MFVKDSQTWFKPKKWGWGWQPNAWQGWLVVLSYIFYIVFKSWNLTVNLTINPLNNWLIWVFILDVAISTSFLIIISFWSSKS